MVHVWGHNSLAVTHTQLQTRKGTSPIVKQLFDRKNFHVHHIVFKLCMMEKVKKKKERKKERKIHVKRKKERKKKKKEGKKDRYRRL